MAALIVEVTGLAGLLCSVALSPEATLQELRATIEEQTGIPASRQRLFFGLQELRSAQYRLADLLGGAELPSSLVLQLVRRSEEQAQWLEAVILGGWHSVEQKRASVPPQAWQDREFVLAAVARNGRGLQHASAELQADREVVLAAVSQDGRGLQHASAELRVLAAASQGRWAFEFDSQDGWALQYASAELRADREVFLAAVARNGRGLQHASAELQADREVVLAAVSQNGCALQYASAELRADREVVLATCASAELRADREFTLAAVTRNRWALELAEEELEADREIVLAAVVHDSDAL